MTVFVSVRTDSQGKVPRYHDFDDCSNLAQLEQDEGRVTVKVPRSDVELLHFEPCNACKRRTLRAVMGVTGLRDALDLLDEGKVDVAYNVIAELLEAFEKIEKEGRHGN